MHATDAIPHQIAGSDFWRTLAVAGRGILMLDYDGTLAPFRVHPGDAEPYEGIRTVLDEIMDDGRTRLVIVSGRPARELRRLLGLRRPPDIWGTHGREHLDAAGTYVVEPIGTRELRALVSLDDWTPELERAGGRVEPKAGSIAVHWRGETRASIDAIREILRGVWQVEQLGGILEWHDFDGGVELRAPGCSKGRVVMGILASDTTRSPCAFLGDDAQDEGAFAAVRSRGIGVLVGPEARPTAAEYWIRPPAQLIGFLVQWLRSSGAGS